ncbi:hypothetical protein HNR22_000043 [Micromonospora jinlongensis]|uniref:Uncharacterized protein n=1 Tax=Micromonospora jinlongensis TaxID=1287877 RepID=A0A7Z0BB05_9ACTN|nr:hypothetical protein [Micromonospora jinlongensis]NYH40316.1 hypothetical protein [Micromonospora jinlongensis]
MDDAFKPQTVRSLDPAAANRLLHALGTVKDLEERLMASHVRPVPAESQLNRDLAVGNAAFAYNYASNAVGAAIDHLRTWYNMLACDLVKFPMPILAHYTLARAVYEPSLHTLWLLDATSTSRERIGRGYAMELQSLRDMRNFQKAAKPSEANAQALIDRVLDGAASDGFVTLDENGARRLTVPVRNMVDLFNDYDGPEIPGRKAEWRYRILSGLAHGRRWAVVANAAEVETATDEGYLIRPNWQYLQHFADYTVRIASRAVSAVVEYRYEASPSVGASS